MAYELDIVLCIDATGSMTTKQDEGPHTIIDLVKEHAANIHEDIKDAMSRQDPPKAVARLRVRIVAFRDIYDDAMPAFEESRFYDLGVASDEAAFKAFVAGLRADGGGDIPESGLEGLGLALRSDWNKAPNANARSIIVLWTDAPAHALEDRKTKAAVHALDLARTPDSLSTLASWWDDGQKISHRGRRLLLFTPDEFPWSDIKGEFDCTVHTPMVTGVDGNTYAEMLMTIANSV